MSGKEEAKSGIKRKNTGKGGHDDKHSAPSGQGNICVVCRFRPLNQNELNHGGSNV